MTPEEQVRQASERFYAALNSVLSGNTAPMAEMWSHNLDVAAMQPTGALAVGLDETLQSWKHIAESISSGTIEVTDLEIRVSDRIAYTFGIEHARLEVGGKNLDLRLRGTSIYRRDDGSWKQIFHHTDVDPSLREAIARQEAA